MSDEKKQLSIGSGFDIGNYAPHVLFFIGGDELTVTPQHARAIALDILHAAESSEQDSFHRQVVDGLDIPDSNKDSYMVQLRQAREDYRQSIFRGINEEQLTEEEVEAKEEEFSELEEPTEEEEESNCKETNTEEDSNKEAIG